MKSMVVNFAVEDIYQTVEYYREFFGFSVQMAVDKEKNGFDTINASKHYIWAMIVNQDVSIMLQTKESLQEDVGTFFDTLGASSTFYVTVENAEVLYDAIKHKVMIYKDLRTTWYGQKEFYVKDLNGYIVCFASHANE